MAHFAQTDDFDVVVRVIVVSNDDAPDPAPNNENSGLLFIDGLSQIDETFSGKWVQTSYNGSFRKQFAGIGYFYDPDADVFISPIPFPSWVLDENYDWVAPIPKPADGWWDWDEDTQSWIEVV